MSDEDVSTIEASPKVRPATIGRDAKLSVVSAAGSISVDRAEISRVDGEASIQDGGSDAGSSRGRGEEDARQLGANESVEHGEDNAIAIGKDDAEIIRVEQAQDHTRNEMEGSPAAQAQGISGNTGIKHDKASHPMVSGKGVGNRDASESRQNHDQPVTESEAKIHSGIVVGVVGAEDLAESTSSTIFRMPKKSRTLRRYVRVSVLNLHDGREGRVAGQTSSVAASGSTCRWGDRGSRGESVRLPTSEDIAEFDVELEVWSDQSGNSTEDFLLGRGRADLRNFRDFHSRWIGLDPKGKIEVWISPSTSLPEDEGAARLDRLVHDGICGDERDERDCLTTPLGADDKHDAGVSAQARPIELSVQRSPTSTKWGRPRLDLKNVLLTTGLRRASNQKTKQPQTAMTNQTNGGAEDVSPQKSNLPEDGNETVNERGGRVTCEKNPDSEHVTHAHQLNHNAKQGLQLMKDSFQARLHKARSSGKGREKDRRGETDEVKGTGVRDEGSLNEGVSALASGNLTHMHSDSSDVAWKGDRRGTSEAQTEGEANRERVETGSGASSEDHAERRRSSHPSPLRSLLQDAPRDEDASEGEVHERDDKVTKNEKDHASDESGGGVAVRRNSAGDEHMSSPSELVAQRASPLDAIIAVKAAASRLKSTWSSPNFTSTLKGFRRNKPKEDAVADVGSSSDSADAVSPTSLSDADHGGIPAKCHASGYAFGSNLPPDLIAVQVTILRASLPEGLANKKFGGTQKHRAFVRVTICDVSASTSAVQAAGRECRWNSKGEGEIVDIPLPSAKLPEFEASALVLEVWTLVSEELEKGMVVGKTDVLVSDWLGKKGWAQLDGKQHQGGRVKLSVALKDPAVNVHVSDKVAVTNCDVHGEKGSQAGEETSFTDAHPNAVITSTADVCTSRRMEEAPLQSEVNTNRVGYVIRQDTQEAEDVYSTEGGKFGVPRVDDKSFSIKSQHSTSPGQNPSRAPVRVEERDIEATHKAANHADFSADATKAECARETNVRSPLLQQQVVRVRHPHVDEQELLIAESTNEKTPPTTFSGASEDGSSEKNYDEGPEMEATRDTCVDLARSSSSGESHAASPSKYPETNIESPPASHEAIDSHERTTQVSRQAIGLALPNAEERSASKDDNIPTFDTPNAPDLDVLGRRTCGGTATALDAAAVECARGQRAAHMTKMASSEAEIEATSPRERPERSEPSGTMFIARGRGVQGGKRGASTRRVQKMATEATAKAPEAQISDVDDRIAQAETIKKRIDRAREILRRRREVACRNRRYAPVDPQNTNSVAAVPPTVQIRAATTIQGAFRGRTARRRLRLYQRSVVKIQTAYRGHMERKAYMLRVERARRAKAEERRARARRSRIIVVTQELNLLRGTPAQQLLRVDELRARACVTRIQRVWRRYRGQGACQYNCGTANKREAQERYSAITATDMGRRNRVPLSDTAFDAVQPRVTARRQAKDSSKRRQLLTQDSTIQCPTETKRDRRANRRVDAKTLMLWQDNASQLTAAFHQTSTKRRFAAKRRSERLVAFKKSQDQLLHPPKLSRSDSAGSIEENSESIVPGQSRARCVDAAPFSWNMAEEPAQLDRARRAHTLALAAAEEHKYWSVNLPPDVGYDELVDIRRVVPSWPGRSVRGRGPLEFVDGFVRHQNNKSGKTGNIAGYHQFDSDEASLWWYLHSATGMHTTGLQKQDRVFASLLEGAKTTGMRRKERAEREEQQHQLLISRKRQTMIAEVVQQRRVASCRSLSYLRKRVTLKQRRAATLIQSYIRRYLGRKQTLLLRAETNIFGALQVLVNELRQPELEPDDTTRQIQTLAAVLADRTKGCNKKERGVRRAGRSSRWS